MDFFALSRTPLAVLDAERRFTRCNPALEALLGSGVDLRGAPLESIVEQTDRPRLAQALEGLVRTPSSRVSVRLDRARFPDVSAATLDVSRTTEDGLTLVFLADDGPAEGATTQAGTPHPSNALETVLDRLPALLWLIDAEGICTAARGRALGTGLEPADLVGLNLIEMFEANPQVASAIVRALGGEVVSHTASPAENVHVQSWYVPMEAAAGAKPGAAGLSVEVTAGAPAQSGEQLALIERQGATIRALATPIIELWDEILCLPVIGTLDSSRTAEMMQGLLRAIVRRQARFAIVDLTGVEIVDSSTADHLIRLFRAARVLGVDGILSGIRPAVANTVVALGLDLGSMKMMRSLKEALRWCIRERERGTSSRSKRAPESNGGAT